VGHFSAHDHPDDPGFQVFWFAVDDRFWFCQGRRWPRILPVASFGARVCGVGLPVGRPSRDWFLGQ